VLRRGSIGRRSHHFVYVDPYSSSGPVHLRRPKRQREKEKKPPGPHCASSSSRLGCRTTQMSNDQRRTSAARWQGVPGGGGRGFSAGDRYGRRRGRHTGGSTNIQEKPCDRVGWRNAPSHWGHQSAPYWQTRCFAYQDNPCNKRENPYTL
jgi:hypothetical protein